MVFWRLIAIVFLLCAPAAPALAAEQGCRPEMALGTPRMIPAALAPGELRLTFVGHASFLIETPQGVRAVTDYNDYVRAAVTPDIATMNKPHSTHFSRRPEPGITHILPGWREGGRFDHDLTLLDLRVRNVTTNIRSWGGGQTELDGNSIFIFELGDLCVVHLGHLHHVLEPAHLRAIGRADIVLAPVDSGYTLDIDGMMEVLAQLSPRVVIPMHFFGQHTLERFIRLASDRYAIERREAPEATFSRESLPDRPTLVILPGR